MRLLDARWTPRVNEILVGCDCGESHWHRLDRWTIRCQCGKTENVTTVREQPIEADMSKETWKPMAHTTTFQVYADGSSTGKADKEGGYAWIILKDGVPLYSGYGGDPKTTNNLMELEGLIKGLEALMACDEYRKESQVWPGPSVELCSDSQYALGIANGSKAASKNLERCKRLKSLADNTKADTRWVKGHTGKDEWQTRCDHLAKKGKEENVKKDSEVRDCQ